MPWLGMNRRRRWLKRTGIVDHKHPEQTELGALKGSWICPCCTPCPTTKYKRAQTGSCQPENSLCTVPLVQKKSPLGTHGQESFLREGTRAIPAQHSCLWQNGLERLHHFMQILIMGPKCIHIHFSERRFLWLQPKTRTGGLTASVSKSLKGSPRHR